jgi:hypothetical protein
MNDLETFFYKKKHKPSHKLPNCFDIYDFTKTTTSISFYDGVVVFSKGTPRHEPYKAIKN